jgi:hypothetical protein
MAILKNTIVNQWWQGHAEKGTLADAGGNIN